ncbi:TPA: antibiotic biosynthesis monooxygenase [Candidatus Poribacteria bacterium]|nr:antibiotic biosynthesis monooxygenase [Candidatus Poribacteria bacterium]
MVVVIFRSWLRDDFLEEYRTLAPSMLELARDMPGFHSFKSFTADDGVRVSIIEFENLAAVKAWPDHSEHQEAQILRRERFSFIVSFESM